MGWSKNLAEEVIKAQRLESENCFTHGGDCTMFVDASALCLNLGEWSPKQQGANVQSAMRHRQHRLRARPKDREHGLITKNKAQKCQK